MNFFLFLIALLVNPWIWRVFSYNFYIWLVIVFLSILYFKYVSNKKKIFLLLSVPLLIILIIFHFSITQKKDLVNFSNDQVRLKDQRLNEYPSLRLPIAHWFEQRKESVIFFRMKENLSEVIDLNYFFFASHPRSRYGVSEFEKFPYLFLPLFILGIFSLVARKETWSFVFLVCVPLIVLTITSDRNLIGAFLLLPFFVISIWQGLTYIWKKLKEK